MNKVISENYWLDPYSSMIYFKANKDMQESSK